MTDPILSPQDTKAAWQSACTHLQTVLSPAVYNTWIVSNPLVKLEFIDDTTAQATIQSPTAFHATNLQKNLHDTIKEALDAVTARNTLIAYRVGESSAQKSESSTQALDNSQPLHNGHLSNGQVQKLTLTRELRSHSSVSPRVEDLFSEQTISSTQQDRRKIIAQRVGLRSDYVFSTFAVSTSNEMAHAAATAVSNRPGEAYNPLFLYGGVGVGKTHLMHAIGNNILEQNTDVKIIYCTGEEFTNDIVQAIQTKKASQFKEKYRTADVLLIDDIQFIAGKNAVQEEFFHTFNALNKQLRQIVLTSDRPPHEINLLESRLRSRFEAGLMIDIQQPSFELRTAILLVKSKAENLHIPIELAKEIAAKVDSARKIEGIITSIRSEVELKHREVNSDLIQEILKAEVSQRQERLKVSPNDVIRAVANHYRLKQSVLKGQRRQAHIVAARHVAMFILKEDVDLPLVEIGKWFSDRDHTSVLHAVRKIESELPSQEQLQQDINALRNTLLSISR
jgi:chromosomal replication initiator protein